MSVSSWYKSWFGYGLGVGAAKAVFGEGKSGGFDSSRGPIRQQTEAEIRADEKRYAEDEKRLDAADAAAKH